MKNKSTKKKHESAAGLSRRSLLGSSASLAAASLLSGQATASARGSGNKPVLVHVFLRNAMDGLTTVVPYGDGDLYIRRPRLAIQPPGPTNGARDLDGFFGLAPSAAPLLVPYSDGHLAVVHASGSDDSTRSHFEAFIRMESGDPRLPEGVITTGWITRYLQATEDQAISPLRAVGTSSLLPLTLRGASDTLPIPNMANFQFPGRVLTAARRQDAIVEGYSQRGAPVGTAALDTIDSFGLGGIDFAGYAPANGAQYPNSLVGGRLRNTAALIKGAIGVEVVTIDVEGWDLHASLGPINGNMARLLDDLTRALKAFYLDLQNNLDDYVLICISEFGRHVRENGSLGTDHGHGNAMFVMGGGVNGGQVIADWPGLGVSDLDQGDLATTIDYRNIIGEVLVERLGVTNLSLVFPDLQYAPKGVTA